MVTPQEQSSYRFFCVRFFPEQNRSHFNTRNYRLRFRRTVNESLVYERTPSLCTYRNLSREME